MNKTKFTDYKAVIRGEVKISSLVDGKVISEKRVHNTATANMLIGIARFLRGDFFHVSTQSETFLPLYLGVGFIGDVDSVSTAANAVKLKAEYSNIVDTRFDVSKGNIEVTNDGEVRLSLSAVIPSGTFAAGTPINELGLFSKRSTNDAGLLARVVMLGSDNKPAKEGDNKYGIVIERNTSERIDWTIVLSNK